MSYLFTVIALSLALLTPAFAQETDPASQPSPQLSPQDRASPAAERVWLNTPGGKDLAFYIAEKTGTAHGGVLILPQPGHHPATLGMIKSLRHMLAENHWHTLTLHIEDQQADAIQQLIAAGISFLNEKGVYNIAILGEGQSAAHALQYIAQLKPQQGSRIQQIRSLIMIDAENYLPGHDDDPMAALAEVKLPVLDAYTAHDYRAQQFAAERKRYAARRQSVYQQTRLPGIGIHRAEQENRITKRIRGWLDNNVAGFMVDRQRR